MAEWEVALAVKRLWDTLPLPVHYALTALVPVLVVWLTLRAARRSARGTHADPSNSR
jgi:hypothetical protein